MMNRFAENTKSWKDMMSERNSASKFAMQEEEQSMQHNNPFTQFVENEKMQNFLPALVEIFKNEELITEQELQEMQLRAAENMQKMQDMLAVFGQQEEEQDVEEYEQSQEKGHTITDNFVNKLKKMLGALYGKLLILGLLFNLVEKSNAQERVKEQFISWSHKVQQERDGLNQEMNIRVKRCKSGAISISGFLDGEEIAIDFTVIDAKRIAELQIMAQHLSKISPIKEQQPNIYVDALVRDGHVRDLATEQKQEVKHNIEQSQPIKEASFVDLVSNQNQQTQQSQVMQQQVTAGPGKRWTNWSLIDVKSDGEQTVYTFESRKVEHGIHANVPAAPSI